MARKVARAWPIITANKEKILSLRRGGATLAQCAASVGLSREALRLAMHRHDEFRKEMNAAVIPLCAAVRGKLTDLAMGRGETRERMRVIKNGEVVAETAKIVQHAPSVGAALAILRRYEDGTGWGGVRAGSGSEPSDYLFDTVHTTNLTPSEATRQRVDSWWAQFAAEFGVTDDRGARKKTDYSIPDDEAAA